MVGYSSSVPEQWVEKQGGFQFRYNIEEIEREMEDGQTVTEWQYEYVDVQNKERGTLIDALITERYPHNSQLGKLACDRASEEWQEYEAFRQQCYAIASEALG